MAGSLPFDPFLYLALVAGYVAGRLIHRRSPWIGRAALGTVFVLILLLGASLASASPAALLEAIPYAIGLVALVLLLTVAVTLLLPHSPGRHGAGPTRFPIFVPILLVALFAGYGIGRNVAATYPSLLTAVLYVLLFLVAFDLRLELRTLHRLATPIVAAFVGAILGGLLFALLTGLNVQVALAASLGFGWYSLAGPLVASRFGATAGLIAFLTNFLREDLTMMLAPTVGPHRGPEAVTAMGGATTMDTTLLFVTRYGDPSAASLALASGLLLTISASLALPLVLGFP